tara:strand:+ start:626 stop:739 length:114 start_codon:yes stop_codon:yes gene_type:complete
MIAEKIAKEFPLEVIQAAIAIKKQSQFSGAEFATERP